MFEPLPSLIRLQRERRGISQDRLAKLAGVSRGQLIALEKGDQNISLLFLLKVARALDITELRIADLYLHPSPPDVTMVIKTAEAIATADRIFGAVTAEGGELEKAKASIAELMDRILGPMPGGDIGAAGSRLAEPPRAERGRRTATAPKAAAPRAAKKRAQGRR